MEVMGNLVAQEDIRIHRQRDLEETEQIQKLIRVRWWAPALIAAAVGLSVLGGLDDRFLLLLWAAGYILAYNLLCYQMNQKPATTAATMPSDRRRSIYWQAALDCSAVCLLAYLSGGIASPAYFLLAIPTGLVASRLAPRPVYTFTACVLACVTLLAIFEQAGWLPHRFMVWQSQTSSPVRSSGQFFFDLSMIYFTVLAVASLAVSMSNTDRRNTCRLEDSCESLTRLNQKFWRLFSMIQTIGSTPNLNQVLNIVSSQTAAVMNVKGISIKLLSEDARMVSGPIRVLHRW